MKITMGISCLYCFVLVGTTLNCRLTTFIFDVRCIRDLPPQSWSGYFPSSLVYWSSLRDNHKKQLSTSKLLRLLIASTYMKCPIWAPWACEHTIKQPTLMGCVRKKVPLKMYWALASFSLAAALSTLSALSFCCLTVLQPPRLSSATE